MRESKNESTREMMNEENARALVTWLRSRVAMLGMRVDRGEVVQLLDAVDWLFEDAVRQSVIGPGHAFSEGDSAFEVAYAGAELRELRW